MTVIAYRDGVLAGDSCWSDNGLVTTRASKLFRLKSGGVIGEAGDADSREMRELFTEVTGEDTMPTRKQLLEVGIDYHGLLVLADGSVWDVSVDIKNNDAGLYPVREPYYAVGAGKMLALGVMWKGGTAEEAVQCACESHTDCCLPVTTLSLTK